MSNFFRDKPLRKTAAESYENDSDQEFIADSDENRSSGSESHAGSESSDEVERMTKNEYKRSRRRILRRQSEKKKNESQNSSASSTEDLSQKLANSQNLASSSGEEERQLKSTKRRKRNKMTISTSSEDEKPPKKIQQRRTRRTTRQNRVRKVFVAIDSDDDKPHTQNLASSEEDLEKPTNTISVPIETPLWKNQFTNEHQTGSELIIPIVPLTKTEITLESKSGFFDDEAYEKRPSETESSDGDSEPHKTRPATSKPNVIVSSDESDVETKAQRKSRRPLIKDSSDSDENVSPVKKIPRAWQNTSESSDSEALDQDLSDFVVSDDENHKKLKEKSQVVHNSGSDSSSNSEEENPQNRSILSQLAPELVQDLRRDQVLSKADFKMICKLFIMDQMNPKSLDNANGTKDGFSEEFQEFNSRVRKAITRMDNSLNDSTAKCVTGAWNAIVRRRIDMHSTMSTVPALHKWKCKVCNRKRKCSVMVSLIGYEYNRTSLRQNKNAHYEIADEEIPFMEDVNGQTEYKNEDDSENDEDQPVPGVLFSVGPRCFFRMDLYHEARHYKAQLYQEIKEEFNHQLEHDAELEQKHNSAQRCDRKPDRIVGSDLLQVADAFTAKMQGLLDMSYVQYTGIATRARDVDLQAGYIDEEHVDI